MVDVGAAPIDRYVVLEHLSEGGMGAIYVGKKLGAGGFEMEVVLKQLLPEFTQQEEFIDLFLREAKLSATLDHANIVHTIDLVTAGGEYFIVMEYLPGGDLRTLLKKAKRRGKRFSPAAAIHISREVLSALAYAHVKRDFEGNPLRLIHRDVSPSNILVSHAGEVKLTDFGIAKAATHNSLFYKVKGKIGYMSPEQAKSEAIDHRADLYSLAVCMYEVLTGERLFVHAGLTTSADEIYSQPVPQVSRKVAGLTTDLDAIMYKALALSPDARFQTAGEFQEALTRCAHRNGLLVSAPEVARELVDLCGPPDQWRGEDDDDDLGYVHRAATEVYDGGDEDEDEAGPLSIHGLASRQSSSRISRPKTEIAKVGGVVELTSIINMIDLEHQHREAMANKARAEIDAGGPAAPPLFGARPSVTRPGPAIAPLQPPPAGMQPRPRTTGMQERQPRQPMQPVMQPMQPMQPQPPRAMSPGMQPMQPMQPHVDVSDLIPTQPRPLPAMPVPPMPVPPSPGVLESRWVPHLQAPSRAGSQGKKRSFLQPWMVIVAIILAAAAVGVVIAMSGPDVAVQHSK
ncbi:MAG: serine/threonine protein kinase [Deltaproteobacteria bacterium]|nr:MAG: serine/threonine protein kinase [Deltaproteobacteria bacterium]TMQ18444.1 MAG: serine/threonine protein kinase [Deltaproteobacteria bacterium]